ncbi:hypothetical protein QKC54_gp0464 [Megavirus baoshan]|uniref:Uncharacterized protein n=1 Tax=Megavirus baoshan TaxID=2496520 RepID=A0A3S8UX16_9VIRU|nr:hypothetical protein QKC54_gp0464 [Megavirus baoshan]AZL89364.1 hypothetical protein Mb0608 [Megavirus baoshan]
MSDQNNYSDEIYQLDGLIAYVYDAFYTKNNNYKIKFIDVENSKLDRFKMSDYNLDIIFNKIIYRGTYSTGIVIKGNNIEEIHFKRLGETHASTIRIVPYTDVKKIDDKMDPVNVNQIMKTVLSELVAAEKTNGILLPIINIDVSGSDLLVYDKVAQYINPKLYYSLQITEKYYKLITLDDFFKNYAFESKILKSIIYQAIDVLYQINISYPEFRYNQLIPDKIDCYLKKYNDITVPQIKLSYFYLSNIEELVNNEQVDKLKIPYIDSPYSDLYQLLNYMWNNIQIEIQKYPEIIKIFDTLLPKKIRSNESYLTQEIWDLLDDGEKFNLTIKNIKNSGIFTSRDSLLNTDFMPIYDELSGGQEIDDDLIFQESEFNAPIEKLKYNKTKNKFKNNSRIKSKNNSRNILNTNVDVLNNELNDDISDMDALITITQESQSDKSNNSDMSINKRGNNQNKKYYHNHIDNMSGKRQNKKYDYSDNFDTSEDNERTEERIFNKPSKLISISDADINVKKSAKNNRQSRIYDSPNDNTRRKNKAYRGKRQITNQHASGLITDKNMTAIINSNMAANSMNNGMPSYNNYNETFDSQNLQPMQNTNSIGSLLGVSPNEIGNRNNNPNYSQIGQQMAQMAQIPQMSQISQNMMRQIPGQYQSEINQSRGQYNNQYMSNNLAPNVTNQIPVQIQNPMGNNPMGQNLYANNGSVMQNQQIDNDTLARYLAAAGQMNSNTSNLDSNLMSTMLQQNNQMPYMAQTGGINKNQKDFFFR